MILVTGAGGYVGGHLLERLKERGEPVRGLVRGAASAEKVKRAGFEAVQGDVTDRPSLERAMQGVNTVIHLAAINRERGKMTIDLVNRQGTVNVVDAAKAAGVTHIVNVIGLGADPTRSEPLPRSQGEGLVAIQNSSIPYTVITPSVIFGRGDEFINTIAGLIRLAPILPVPGTGEALFHPVWVGDVAEAVMRSLAEPGRYQGVFPLGGPEIMTYNRIVATVAQVMGKPCLRVPMPLFLLKPAVSLMNATLAKPPVTPALVDLLGRPNVANPNTALTVFKLKPKRLADGIDYVRELTVGTFVNRTLGRVEYR
ncbi:MAG: NAD(P)H-binding protein [Anaerolineae bacterium]|nr:NAD(P)H-binding protein [Anaerolineae bacterium]